MPDLRVDPLSGRTVVVAPGRARRPGANWARLEPETPEELESCPFCEGREERTPPELLSLPEGREPDTPGWSVRVVPNKFPAFEHQEVVVHAPQHVRSLADLDDAHVDLVATAWQLRAKALREEGFAHVFVGINEGRVAGASLPHSHSQLVGLREEPPAADDVGEYIAWERSEESRIVLEKNGLVLLCPFAGRGPYESLIAPLEQEPDAFHSPLLGPALRLAADALRRIAAAEGPPPVNAWLRTGSHWRIEILPRFTVMAAIELGLGYYVNPLAPERAAETLRS